MKTSTDGSGLLWMKKNDAELTWELSDVGHIMLLFSQ